MINFLRKYIANIIKLFIEINEIQFNFQKNIIMNEIEYIKLNVNNIIIFIFNNIEI